PLSNIRLSARLDFLHRFRDFFRWNAGQRTERIHRLTGGIQNRRFDWANAGALRFGVIVFAFGAFLRIDLEMRRTLINRVAGADVVTGPAVHTAIDNFQSHDVFSVARAIRESPLQINRRFVNRPYVSTDDS